MFATLDVGTRENGLKKFFVFVRIASFEKFVSFELLGPKELISSFAH